MEPAGAFAARTLRDRDRRLLVLWSEGALAASRLLVVDPRDPTCYATIGAAVAAAEPGDRVAVRPGRYEESVVIDKAIRLSGDDRAGTVVRGITGPALTITGSGATVSRMTLRRPSDDHRIAFRVPLDPAALRVGVSCIVEELTTDGPVLIDGGSPFLRGCEVVDERSRARPAVRVWLASPTLDDCDVPSVRTRAWPLATGDGPRLRLLGCAIGPDPDVAIDCGQGTRVELVEPRPRVELRNGWYPTRTDEGGERAVTGEHGAELLSAYRLAVVEAGAVLSVERAPVAFEGFTEAAPAHRAEDVTVWFGQLPVPWESSG